MIDTDKYEGHAEGEWTIEQNDTGDECAIDAQDYGTIAQTFYRDSDKLFYATSRLIADAPLLLEAYKRLHEQIVDMIDSMDNYYIRDIRHATDCLRDMIGYYEDEEE